MIQIYTDGSCNVKTKNNSGDNSGSYGICVVQDDNIKCYCPGRIENTTNNRMELSAFIKAFEIALQFSNDNIEIVSDSKYCVDAYNQYWLLNWIKLGYFKNLVYNEPSKKGIKNADLWIQFITTIDKTTDGTFVKFPKNIKVSWIKGHAGHIYNEKCDQLANNQQFINELE